MLKDAWAAGVLDETEATRPNPACTVVLLQLPPLTSAGLSAPGGERERVRNLTAPFEYCPGQADARKVRRAGRGR